MAVKTANAAIAYAKGQSSKPSKNWNNLCLQFVRTCFGVAAKHPNAKKAWEATTKKHKTTNASSIPAGVPVWFKTSTVNWHVAISTGNGNCYSTDVGGRGKVGLITINGLCKAWGITLLGGVAVTVSGTDRHVPVDGASLKPDRNTRGNA